MWLYTHLIQGTWGYCGERESSYVPKVCCDVTGKILMKCFLSGMPDLKLGLIDKIVLEQESKLKIDQKTVGRRCI
ncbi:hypothetical protein MKW98_011916 [Papaver atlanticum]|uniref:Uncharacterized protein n=1 Tax=Papaver atlanticum TaxID=357466 RepID=A0AAD4T5X1_9MAGN|nr:hypothetical protein MKW98_011916 [Papaver atlanticum]